MLRTDPRVQRFAEGELRALILHDMETGEGLLDVLRGDANGAVIDVGVTTLAVGDFDAESVLLIILRQRDDAARESRGEQ